MRRLLPLFLLLPAAALAQVPAGQPPVLRIPGLSAAGVAALDKLKNRQDPAVPRQVAAEQAFRQQMAAVLAAPAVDPDKLAATLAQGRLVQSNARKIMDDHLLVMLRALPPGDRKAFLRAVATPQVAPPGK